MVGLGTPEVAPQPEGLCDPFIGKYSSEGEVQWEQELFGLDAVTQQEAVALDKEGSLYVAGWTTGPLPGQEHFGAGDAFLRKYSAEGQILWTRGFGSENSDRAFGAGLDSRGNVYVVGQTEGALPGHSNRGQGDAFLRKYDPQGEVLGTLQFGTEKLDAAYGVAVDREGNLYVVGGTEGTFSSHTNRGGMDAFLRKYSPAGEELWTRQLGSEGSDVASRVVVDSRGNISIAGNTSAALPGQTQAGQEDVFLQKYSPEGVELWTRQVGSEAPDLCRGLTVDGEGNVYGLGMTLGVLPGHRSLGGWDVFLLKYNSEGEEQRTLQFGSSDNDDPSGLAVDGGGNVYVALQVLPIIPEQASARSGVPTNVR